MDICTCVQSLEQRKKLAKLLLHLNHHDLNAETIHSLRHCGYYNIRIVAKSSLLPFIVNKTEIWKTICRMVKLNGRFFMEEIDIEDDIVTGTRFRNLKTSTINACPCIVIEANEL